jgi:hypothetical protein
MPRLRVDGGAAVVRVRGEALVGGGVAHGAHEERGIHAGQAQVAVVAEREDARDRVVDGRVGAASDRDGVARVVVLFVDVKGAERDPAREVRRREDAVGEA